MIRWCPYCWQDTDHEIEYDGELDGGAWAWCLRCRDEEDAEEDLEDE